MCLSCWDKYGRPKNWTPEIAEALGLVRELYELNAVGGPLHVVVDDWNLDGQIEPYYQGDEDAEMVRVCDRIAALFNGMSVADRASVLAYEEGHAKPGDPFKAAKSWQ